MLTRLRAKFEASKEAIDLSDAEARVRQQIAYYTENRKDAKRRAPMDEYDVCSHSLCPRQLSTNAVPAHDWATPAEKTPGLCGCSATAPALRSLSAALHRRSAAAGFNAGHAMHTMLRRGSESLCGRLRSTPGLPLRNRLVRVGAPRSPPGGTIVYCVWSGRQVGVRSWYGYIPYRIHPLLELSVSVQCFLCSLPELPVGEKLGRLDNQGSVFQAGYQVVGYVIN